VHWTAVGTHLGSLWGVRPGPPHEASNEDTEQAHESMRKLAALDLSAAWPGHADALKGDVRGQLERAAAA
jgi:hypothetical protein